MSDRERVTAVTAVTADSSAHDAEGRDVVAGAYVTAWDAALYETMVEE